MMSPFRIAAAYLWSGLILSSAPSVTGQGVIQGGAALDFPDAVPAWDLPDIPPWLWLLQQAGFKFRDSEFTRMFAQQVDDLGTSIEKAIGERPVGYLLKIQFYADEGGVTVIPNGQLVIPIGAGHEPLDALAEYYRSDQLEVPKPTELRNLSEYVWIRRVNGKIWASTFPTEARTEFEQQARAEARRRDILADPLREDQRVQRATYWGEVATQYAHDVEKQETQRRIGEMTKEFSQLEAEFNSQYQQFLQLQDEYAKRAETISFLDKAITVSNFVEKAEERGWLTPTKNGAEISTASDGITDSLGSDRETLSEREKSLLLQMRQVAPEMDEKGRHLQSLDVTMLIGLTPKATIS